MHLIDDLVYFLLSRVSVYAVTYVFYQRFSMIFFFYFILNLIEYFFPFQKSVLSFLLEVDFFFKKLDDDNCWSEVNVEIKHHNDLQSSLIASSLTCNGFAMQFETRDKILEFILKILNINSFVNFTSY